MKKFFLCFAVILLFVIAGCGDVKVNTPDNGDSGDTNSDKPDTGDDSDSDTSDTNSDNPDSDNPDTGATGECEISDFYTKNYFGEYFRFRGEMFINDLDKITANSSAYRYTEDVTAQLYLDNKKYRFEKVEGEKGGDRLLSQVQNNLGDTKDNRMLSAFSKKEGVYLATYKMEEIENSGIITADLYTMTAIPKSDIKAGKKDPNGRVNLQSAPQVIVFSVEYHDIQAEEGWQKICPVAVTVNAGKNGGAQLCPGEDGSFDSEQTIKIGVNVELSSDEEEILAYANARSIEDVCMFGCNYLNMEFDPETKKCGCIDGYTWDAGRNECVEDTDDSDTESDDSDTESDDSDTESVEPCEIDDSYMTSPFNEYFRFKGAAEINANSGDTPFHYASDVTMELNLALDGYDMIQGNGSHSWVILDDSGSLSLLTQRFDNSNPNNFFVLAATIESDVLNNTEIAPNGKMNLNVPLTRAFTTELLYSGEEMVVKSCTVAVNEETSGRHGSAQICLGSGGNLGIGETIQIGINAELTSDEEEVIGFHIAHFDNTPVCTFTCQNENAEVKNNVSGKCGCVEGYFWYDAENRCVENPCAQSLFEEIPDDSTYVYAPCNKWFADEHTDGSCTPINATTYECGCVEGYGWDGSACVEN